MPNANMIQKGLWLGNINSAYSEAFLRRHNIKLVINCTDHIPTPNFYKRMKIDTIRLPLNNHNMNANNEIMYYNLPAVENEIYNALQHNKNVLVHCFEGKHRSAAVVEYFLMKRKFGFDYKKAFDFIKKKRHVAFIPQDFFHDFLLNYNQ